MVGDLGDHPRRLDLHCTPGRDHASHAKPGGRAGSPNRARESDPAAPKTIVVRRTEPGSAVSGAAGHMAALGAGGAGYYAGGQRIPVPTY